MAAPRVVLTGAAGGLGHDILPALLDAGFDVIGLDVRPGGDPRIPWVRCDLADTETLGRALAGAAAVIHLAGIPLEADWGDISRVNIDGTQHVLHAAWLAAVPRAVLASSVHAAGFTRVPPPGRRIPDDTVIRPNTFYGVSKAALEALGRLYHDRYGMDVVCLRIASRFAAPQNERMLGSWLSPADAGRLFVAALTAPHPGFQTVWGVSANTRSCYSAAGGERLGYRPEDDAEAFAGDILRAAEHDPQIAATAWDREFIGGVFCSEAPPRYVRLPGSGTGTGR
ncbi:NAD(P)-dependent oxidoreductase [Microbacterium kribbense]|uniref:NAD(P)-dependent oxidoreductase n=1 Tax=Microbacterium kribbense TaxID=433645 RepID=A0ABP7FZ65_9MICO